MLRQRRWRHKSGPSLRVKNKTESTINNTQIPSKWPKKKKNKKKRKRKLKEKKTNMKCE